MFLKIWSFLLKGLYFLLLGSLIQNPFEVRPWDSAHSPSIRRWYKKCCFFELIWNLYGL